MISSPLFIMVALSIEIFEPHRPDRMRDAWAIDAPSMRARGHERNWDRPTRSYDLDDRSLTGSVEHLKTRRYVRYRPASSRGTRAWRLRPASAAPRTPGIPCWRRRPRRRIGQCGQSSNEEPAAPTNRSHDQIGRPARPPRRPPDRPPRPRSRCPRARPSRRRTGSNRRTTASLAPTRRAMAARANRHRDVAVSALRPHTCLDSLDEAERAGADRAVAPER